MPIDYKKYPENWKTEIRPRILRRAGGSDDDPRAYAQCELCGIQNYAIKAWHKKELTIFDTQKTYKDAMHFKSLLLKRRKWDKASIVVLTIMHLDHDTLNNSNDNLKAGCQSCHNKHDAVYRRRK